MEQLHIRFPLLNHTKGLFQNRRCTFNPATVWCRIHNHIKTYFLTFYSKIFMVFDYVIKVFVKNVWFDFRNFYQRYRLLARRWSQQGQTSTNQQLAAQLGASIDIIISQHNNLYQQANISPCPAVSISWYTTHRRMQGWCVPDRCVPDRKFLDVAPLNQSVPWILCPWPMCPDPGPREAWNSLRRPLSVGDELTLHPQKQDILTI
jgi:hypothetical protein